MPPDMPDLTRGRYRARVARSAGDLDDVRALRRLAFGVAEAEADAFDDICTHVLIRERAGGALMSCFRMQLLRQGAAVADSYSAQFYDLSALERLPGPKVELGRFCVRPNLRDPDVLRVAWGALTGFVDARGVTMLFGCASFAGTGTGPYLDAFAMLRARHLAPSGWRPGIKAPDVYRYAALLRGEPDIGRAMARMPPLLKSYLAMGGRVSDHAVVDRRMDTLHVFTGVEIAAIPQARKRLLRAVVG